MRRQPAVEAPLHPHPVSIGPAAPTPQLNLHSTSHIWNRHSSPSIKPVDKPHKPASITGVPSSASTKDKKEKQGGILGRFRHKRKEEKERMYLDINLLI